jgi:hypothetical protein
METSLGLPFDFILQKDPAIAAEPFQFPIHIPDAPAVVHDTGMIWAMTEIEGVAQFVDRLLENAAVVGFETGIDANPFLEPVSGDDARSSSQLGFSVDMGQNGNKEIHSRDA